MLGVLLAVAVEAPSLLWAAPTAALLLCGALAVHRFRSDVLQRWLDRGYLFVADALLVGLAMLGATGAGALVFVGLFGVLLVTSVSADRLKAGLAGGAVLGITAALGTSGLAPAPAPGDLIYLPVLVTALLHFGDLAARIERGGRTVSAGGPELWALLDITDTITSTLDVSEVMHAIVERVGELASTPSCSILLADPRSPSVFVVASKGHPEVEMMEVDLGNYPEVRQALSTRAPVLVEDVDSHPLVASARELLLSQGYRSLLVLPLLYGKEVLGALFLKSRGERPLTQAVLRFCKVAACVSANALKNSMLYRDVTQEAASHRETGQKLRRLLDGSPDMILATDEQGRITEFNRGAELLTGRSAERCLGRPLSEILGGSTNAEAPTGAGDVPRDALLRTGDGREIEISLASAPLSAAGGEPAGRVWIGRDVTKLRRVEKSLAQAERLSSLGEVVAGVAHELNNPLSGVVGYAELLRSHASDPEQIRDLQRILESALRCQRIVFKLLSFARQHPPEKKLQKLNDCVRKVLDLKAYHLRSSQIETVLELSPDLPATSFDFHQIEQVVLNLLNNAEQAITSFKRSGRVTLRTGREGDELYIEVQDDGPGIRGSDRERVFDPFFTTKEVGRGTGLGLSVSYGIVQEHGGRIELLPERPQAGACFRVWLPLVETDEVPVVAAAEPAGPMSPNPLSGRTVLVAEDEPVVAELLARLLAEDGAKVVLARDGREAWEKLSAEEFDLVVADLRMPNFSGQQLYEKVAEERPELLRRFVFATGDLARQETLSFLDGLPNRILTKPLELETVRRVLSQAILAA